MVVKLGGEAWNVPFAMVVSSTALISVRDGTQLGVSLRVMVVATPQGTRHYKNRSFSPVLRPDHKKKEKMKTKNTKRSNTSPHQTQYV
jgi:hypothetical protein